jgi:hypothetical protein
VNSFPKKVVSVEFQLNGFEKRSREPYPLAARFALPLPTILSG